MTTVQHAVKLSANAAKILTIVQKGDVTREAIAKRLRTTVPTVNGSITSLKRNNLVTVGDDGMISAAKGSADVVIEDINQHTPRSQSKMAQATKLFNKFNHKGRQVVLDKFAALGLTKAGASTYYQTIKTRSEAAVEEEVVAPAPRSRARKSSAAAAHA